jgi:hypothetical protein
VLHTRTLATVVLPFVFSKKTKRMPPLLAALLMIELGCTLDIVMAIDLSVQWRKYPALPPNQYSQHWYDGEIGILHPDRNTFFWPSPMEPTRTYLNHTL